MTQTPRLSVDVDLTRYKKEVVTDAMQNDAGIAGNLERPRNPPEFVTLPHTLIIRSSTALPGHGTIPDPDPEGSQEGVAADAKGNLYGSLTGGMALKKYVKK